MISASEVAGNALNGVVNAQKAYEKWSGGGWLWRAPESLISTFVAQELAGMEGGKYLTLEHNIRSAMKDAGGVGRGRLPKAMKATGRFDILLWWANDTPRAPIEVKNQVLNIRKIESDLRRIKEAITRGENTFQFGMMVFYSSCKNFGAFSARERLEKYMENIDASCKAMISGCSMEAVRSRTYEDGDSAWGASAIVLKPN